MGKKKLEPEKESKFKEKGEEILIKKTPEELEPKKRIRRTRAELEAEKNSLNDNGFELFADFMKMLSDNDSVKYGLPKEEREFFEPLSRQYSSIMNYFMPAAKPIYFAIGTAFLGSFMMLKSRAEKIAKTLPPKEKKPNGDKPAGEESHLNPGEKRPGQEFPGETPIDKI